MREETDSKKNKAVYTATCVAGGWAGAVMPICTLKAKLDGPTNRPTEWVIGRVARDKNGDSQESNELHG